MSKNGTTTMKLVKVKVSAINPNPYRNMDHYPVNRDKIAELQKSYEATGVWPTIVGRKAGVKTEIAFGHHRWVAAKEAGIREIPVNVGPLSNRDMLKMMADENSEDWGSNSAIDQETIEAVIKAYAAGDIDLSDLLPKSRSAADWITAPSVLPDQRSLKSVSHETQSSKYTALAIARFLGWTKKTGPSIQPSYRFAVAWHALQSIERGVMKKMDYAGLTRKQADVVNKEALRVWKEWEAEERRLARLEDEHRKAAERAHTARERQKQEASQRKAAEKRREAEKIKKSEAAAVTKGLAGDLKKGKTGVVKSAENAKTHRKRPAPKKPLPNVSTLARNASKLVGRFLNVTNKAPDKAKSLVDAVAEFNWSADPVTLAGLAKDLRALAKRCESLASRVEKQKRPPKDAETKLIK